MKIKVFGELEIQRFKTNEEHIVISVQDPNYDFVKLPEQKSRLGWIGLKLHDSDTNICPETSKENTNIVLFNKLHAQSILNFLNEWKNGVNLICINCGVGISRSAGIAGALSKILNGDDDYYFKNYCPNMLVYRTILNEYYGDNFHDFNKKEIKSNSDIKFI